MSGCVTLWSIRSTPCVLRYGLLDTGGWVEACPTTARKHRVIGWQWSRQDLVPGGAHAKVTGFLQEATVDM